MNMTSTSSAGEESDNQPLQVDDHAGPSFVIVMIEKPRRAPPKRFTEYQKRTITREELDQKQLDAENRRKKLEQEMVSRMQQKTRGVHKMNQNLNALLAAAVKQQRTGDHTDTLRLSPHELKAAFCSVKKDYMKTT